MAKAKLTKDIGLVMGSKDMAMWTTTRDNLKQAIDKLELDLKVNLPNELKVNKAFLDRAETELMCATDTWEAK